MRVAELAVHERTVLLRLIWDTGAETFAIEVESHEIPDAYHVSGIRRLLGDKTYVRIDFNSEPEAGLLTRVDDAFPESDIVIPFHGRGRTHRVARF